MYFARVLQLVFHNAMIMMYGSTNKMSVITGTKYSRMDQAKFVEDNL